MRLIDWRTEVQSIIGRLQGLLLHRIIPAIDISKENFRYMLFNIVTFPDKWPVFTTSVRMEGKMEFNLPKLTEEEKDVLREELIIFLKQRSRESLERKKK